MQNAHLEQSLKFAQHVDREMKGGAIRRSRGISQDPFYVLWRTAMPAVLVECGFMSNDGDREALITEQGRDKIASDLYAAFKAYKKEYDGGTATVAETPAPAPEETLPDEAVPEAEEALVYGTQVLVSSKVLPSSDPFFMLQI